MLQIRPAKTVDHAAVVQLWHRGWHDAHAALVPEGVLTFRTPDHFTIWLHEACDTFYVAVDPGLLGFVSIKGTEVVKLYVDRDVRGQGVAHRLLSLAEARLAENGVEEAELFCTAGNVRAEKFYQREGWTLSRSFDDGLWMPKSSTDRFFVRTHQFQKRLKPTP
ncbi:MAG TPA: GNAT family N-acetyltransferase [Mesorhizobium sp.]|jgi:putative acetyltransferase|uniref:GNAT family N-acetyltransferase n=1 Tax=Mesorhizobium sp. TaxID=1871066 RepID=UPI002DDD5C58|nr:GNAT family N-acetyltransferase [Mesorhizobium sp.]HEV2503545.1 GNAT family N-acetyltransferase [Mesorhizobium sp.]